MIISYQQIKDVILNLKCPLVFKFKCALYNTLVTCFSIYTYGVHRSTPFHGTWSSNCNNQIYCYIKSTLVNNTIIHIFNDNFFSFSYLYPISMPLCFKFFFNPYINIRFSIHIHTRHCLCMHQICIHGPGLNYQAILTPQMKTFLFDRCTMYTKNQRYRDKFFKRMAY